MVNGQPHLVRVRVGAWVKVRVRVRGRVRVRVRARTRARVRVRRVPLHQQRGDVRLELRLGRAPLAHEIEGAPRAAWIGLGLGLGFHVPPGWVKGGEVR